MWNENDLRDLLLLIVSTGIANGAAMAAFSYSRFKEQIRKSKVIFLILRMIVVSFVAGIIGVIAFFSSMNLTLSFMEKFRHSAMQAINVIEMLIPFLIPFIVSFIVSACLFPPRAFSAVCKETSGIKKALLGLCKAVLAGGVTTIILYVGTLAVIAGVEFYSSNPSRERDYTWFFTTPLSAIHQLHGLHSEDVQGNYFILSFNYDGELALQETWTYIPETCNPPYPRPKDYNPKKYCTQGAPQTEHTEYKTVSCPDMIKEKTVRWLRNYRPWIEKVDNISSAICKKTRTDTLEMYLINDPVHHHAEFYMNQHTV